MADAVARNIIFDRLLFMVLSLMVKKKLLLKDIPLGGAHLTYMYDIYFSMLLLLYGRHWKSEEVATVQHSQVI